MDSPTSSGGVSTTSHSSLAAVLIRIHGFNQSSQLGILVIGQTIHGIEYIQLLLGVFAGLLKMPGNQDFHGLVHILFPPKNKIYR